MTQEKNEIIMDKIEADVFTYCPFIDIPNINLHVYTNPIHGISLYEAERKVCQAVENNPLYRKIIATRIREYANAFERGEIEMNGYISDYDGYPVPLHTKIEQIDWTQIKSEE